MNVRPIFAWYDLWVGAFWDGAKRRLYLFPVPMFGVVLQFTKPTAPRHETFTCQGCGSGPWDISWDPHEQPVMGRIGGRFGPCCSGAD